MSNESNVAEINRLVAQIKYFNFQYWNMNDPQISDYGYDTIIEQLKTRDPNNPILDFKGSYSLIAKNNKLDKVVHKRKMLSLAKFYYSTELIKWAESVSRDKNEVFKLEPKFDGIAGKIDRDTGTLSTSGDTGEVGENITHKLPLINFEMYTGVDTRIEVLGEIILLKNVFEQHKHELLRKNGKEYKIPRSAVIGLLATEEVSDPKFDKILTFIDYRKYSNEYTVSQLKLIDWDKYIQQLKGWEYPLDGLVLKLKDQEYFDSLGETSHHYLGNMSLKFGNPTGITKLLDIQLQSGKHTITPVGIVEKVVIEGIDNRKMSFHNFKYVIDNDICVGDTIEIERCGEIIPQFKRIVEKSTDPNRTVISTFKCPDCQSSLVYDEPNLICPNRQCAGRIVKVLTDSVVRIGIEELGPGTIKKLVLEKGITSLKQILDLTYSDVITLSGFAELSANNLICEIQKVKSKPIYDYNILSSFNISGVGTRMSKKILKQFDLFELSEMSVNELMKIDGVGPERAILLYEFLDDLGPLLEVSNELNEMIDSKYIKEVKKINVCFTGKNSKPRNYWVELSKQNGLEFIKSVTKEVNILVTNDVNSTSNKIKTAKKYGCKIITYEQFVEFLNNL